MVLKSVFVGQCGGEEKAKPLYSPLGLNPSPTFYQAWTRRQRSWRLLPGCVGIATPSITSQGWNCTYKASSPNQKQLGNRWLFLKSAPHHSITIQTRFQNLHCWLNWKSGLSSMLQLSCLSPYNCTGKQHKGTRMDKSFITAKQDNVGRIPSIQSRKCELPIFNLSFL